MRVEKAWGHELILHNGDYCAKLLVYDRPIASSLHYHEHKHETFYVASGSFDIDDGMSPARRLDVGSYVVLPPHTRHRVRCVTPGVIIESSTHDDPNDCVRLIPSEY